MVCSIYLFNSPLIILLTTVEALSQVVLALSRPKQMNNGNDPTPLPVQALRNLLADTSTSELKYKALHGFILARQQHSPHSHVRGVFGALKRWQEGGRGYLVSLVLLSVMV